MRDTAQIFLDNLASAEAVAKRLAASRATLAPLFPLKPERWETLTRLDGVELDAFLKRFDNLHKILERQVFRSVLMLEWIAPARKSPRDIANLLEKLGALPSAADWCAVTTLSHTLAHENPAPANRLNEAFEACGTLLTTLEEIRRYCRRKALVDLP